MGWFGKVRPQTQKGFKDDYRIDSQEMVAGFYNQIGIILTEKPVSGNLANFDQIPERFTKAIYGSSALEIRIDLYLWGPFKTFQVFKDLARELVSGFPDRISNEPA